MFPCFNKVCLKFGPTFEIADNLALVLAPEGKPKAKLELLTLNGSAFDKSTPNALNLEKFGNAVLEDKPTFDLVKLSPTAIILFVLFVLASKTSFTFCGKSSKAVAFPDKLTNLLKS